MIQDALHTADAVTPSIAPTAEADPGLDPGRGTTAPRGRSRAAAAFSHRFASFWPWLKSLRNPLIGALVLVALWQLFTMTGLIKFYVLPAPLDVLESLGKNQKALVKHGTATITVALIGFAIGTVCAIAFAMLFTYSRLAKAALFPTLITLRALPFIAIIPILVVIMGTGYEPRIVICALGAFFVTLVSTMRGLRSADGEVEELMHTLGASPVQRLMKVRMYAALPYLLTAMRVAASACVIEATVAEWIAGNVGLGYLIQISGYTFQLDLMWSAIVVAAVLTLVLVGIITAVERVATPWIPSQSLAARTAPGSRITVARASKTNRRRAREGSHS